MDEKTGTPYRLNITGEPGWIEKSSSIRKVVFDSSFATARPVSTYSWFGACMNLNEIEGMGYLNTSKVTNMQNMFLSCGNLTSLDVSSFDTQKVTTMQNMFMGCKNLTVLDLSGFDTGNVTNMENMLSFCQKLESIYVGDGWKVDQVTSSGSMFWSCGKLTGENGTTYDSNHTDKGYAHIDGGDSSPGYLTDIAHLVTYDLNVVGTSVTDLNKNDILGNGVFSYSPANKTLSVKSSFKNTTTSSIIYSDKMNDLIIEVTNDAVLEQTTSNRVVVLNGGSVTIKGAGKLTLKTTGSYGIELSNGASLIIDNMNLDIEAFGGIVCMTDDGKLTVKKSNINITCTSSNPQNSPAAIYGIGSGIKLEGCSVTAPEGAYIEWSQAYNTDYSLASSLTITKDSGISTGIDNGLRDSVNGQRDGWYNLSGQRVGKDYKGIVIHNGKKVVIK